MEKLKTKVAVQVKEARTMNKTQYALYIRKSTENQTEKLTVFDQSRLIREYIHSMPHGYIRTNSKGKPRLEFSKDAGLLRKLFALYVKVNKK